MTQKISPAVFSSAARMASAMRRLSTSEIMTSPAPRGAAAPERAAPAGEAAAPRKAVGPGRARRSPRARDWDEDRSACTSSRSYAGLRVSAVLAGDTADNHEENEQKEQKGEDIEEAWLVVRSFFGARLPFLGIDRHRLDDVVDPATDAASEIVRPKARNDGVLDDELRYRVGKRAFEAITDFDAHLAFVRRDDQQRAGILLFLSDLPMTPELVTVVLDRGSLKRLQRNHNELSGGLGLELGELALERGLGRRVEDSGIVDHRAGELREGERAGPSELHRRWLCQILRHRERLHRFVASVERRCPNEARKCLEFRVVGSHAIDVVATRNRNAVSVPSSCDCSARKFWFDFRSG